MPDKKPVDEEWYEKILILAHVFPNTSIFDINQVGLRQFDEAMKVATKILRAQNHTGATGAANDCRSWVDAQLEEIMRDPEKVREILGDDYPTE